MVSMGKGLLVVMGLGLLAKIGLEPVFSLSWVCRLDFIIIIVGLKAQIIHWAFGFDRGHELSEEE